MAETKVKKGILNIITNLLSVIINVILGLCIPRLVMISYGSETNGLVNSINQFVAYLSLFEAGIATTALQELYKPVSEDNRDDINSILSTLNKNYKTIGIIYFIALVVLSAVYPFIVIKDGSPFNYLQVFLCVLFSGLGNVILFLLQGKYRILLEAEGKTYICNNLQSIIQILVSLSKIVLILLGFDVTSVIICTFVVNLIQAAYILIYIKKKYKWINLNHFSSQYKLEKKKFVFVHQIAWLIFQNIDVLLLTIFCDLNVVSIYAMFKLVLSSLEKLLNIPFDSFSFAFGQLFNSDRETYEKAFDTFEVYYEALCFSLLTVCLFLYCPFIKLYTKGADINYVYPILPFLFVGSEILIFMRKPMLNTINYAGHFKETLPQTIAETIVNFGVSIICCIVFNMFNPEIGGICGVLAGTIVALLYRAIDIICYSNKKILNRKPWKNLSFYLINTVLLFGLNIFSLLLPEISSYLMFALIGVISTFVSIIVFALINSLFFKNERKIAISFLKEKLEKIKKKKVEKKS